MHGPRCPKRIIVADQHDALCQSIIGDVSFEHWPCFHLAAADKTVPFFVPTLGGAETSDNYYTNPATFRSFAMVEFRSTLSLLVSILQTVFPNLALETARLYTVSAKKRTRGGGPTIRVQIFRTVFVGNRDGRNR